jgi:hypothetical protein
MAAPTTIATLVHGVTTVVTLPLANTWYALAFDKASTMYDLSADGAWVQAQGLADATLGTAGTSWPSGAIILQQWVPSQGVILLASTTAGRVFQVLGSDRR